MTFQLAASSSILAPWLPPGMNAGGEQLDPRGNVGGEQLCSSRLGCRPRWRSLSRAACVVEVRRGLRRRVFASCAARCASSASPCDRSSAPRRGGRSRAGSPRPAGLQWRAPNDLPFRSRARTVTFSARLMSSEMPGNGETALRPDDLADADHDLGVDEDQELARLVFAGDVDQEADAMRLADLRRGKLRRLVLRTSSRPCRRSAARSRVSPSPIGAAFTRSFALRGSAGWCGSWRLSPEIVTSSPGLAPVKLGQGRHRCSEARWKEVKNQPRSAPRLALENRSIDGRPPRREVLHDARDDPGRVERGPRPRRPLPSARRRR